MSMVRIVALALTLGLLPWGESWAQAPKKDAAQQDPAAGQKPPIPPPEQLAVLIHTAVVALSQANLTGNYSVLHAMASPGFQAANPPDKLGQVFANVRKIDLTPVILYSPILTNQPQIIDQNMLRVTGYYKTAPQQVLFDLLFQPVAGQWRLFGISIGTRPQPTAATPAPTPPAAAAGDATDKKKVAPPPAKK